MQAMRVMRKLQAVVSLRLLKRALILPVLLITVVVFVSFFHHHPQYWQQLQHVPLSTLALVFGLNILLLAILAAIYRTSIRLCGKHIGTQENFLLTAYSSIVNFFGPLQSGPGVRAAYLKTKLHIRLRDYTFVTLLYYALFAVINILFLCIGSLPWWQTVLAILLASTVCVLVLRRFTGKSTRALQALDLQPRLLILLAVLTFLQIAVQCLSFYVELHMINPAVHLHQAITYTGAADLALFVSLTPGAIGFRESFLVFSRSLHHISTATILSANLIDRAVYVVFLFVVFVVAASTHTSTLLKLKKLGRQASEH